jgi:hypothetical protein
LNPNIDFLAGSLAGLLNVFVISFVKSDQGKNRQASVAKLNCHWRLCDDADWQKSNTWVNRSKLIFAIYVQRP